MKKGLKVTDAQRQKKIGVAADSYKELIEKACEKFQVNANIECCRMYVAEDGTLVEDDEYLATLPPQTLLVFIKPYEEMKTDFDVLYELIKRTNIDYLKVGQNAKDFLTTNIKEKLKVLQKYIGQAESGSELSLKEDDPDWFKGLEPSEKVKELSMGRRAKERMRSYFYKVKSALQSSDVYIHSKNGAARLLIDRFLQDLRITLENNNYNSNYFNRKSSEGLRLCNKNGDFNCGGLWNSIKCNYSEDHVINPYRSREERIIFQTWNLDHRIELSRSIIPKIIAAVERISTRNIVCDSCLNKTRKKGFLNMEKYYLQIFTNENLKLVHIVCHYKGKHDAPSGVYLLCYICFDAKYSKNSNKGEN